MRGMIVCGALVCLVGCVKTVVVPPLQNAAVRGFAAHADREWPGTAQQQALTVDTLDWLASAIQSLASTRQLSVGDLPARVQALRVQLKAFAGGNAEQLEQAARLRQLFMTAAALLNDVVVAAGRSDLEERVPRRSARPNHWTNASCRGSSRTSSSDSSNERVIPCSASTVAHSRFGRSNGGT